MESNFFTRFHGQPHPVFFWATQIQQQSKIRTRFAVSKFANPDPVSGWAGFLEPHLTTGRFFRPLRDKSWRWRRPHPDFPSPPRRPTSGRSIGICPSELTGTSFQTRLWKTSNGIITGNGRVLKAYMLIGWLYLFNKIYDVNNFFFFLLVHYITLFGHLVFYLLGLLDSV